MDLRKNLFAFVVVALPTVVTAANPHQVTFECIEGKTSSDVGSNVILLAQEESTRNIQMAFTYAASSGLKTVNLDSEISLGTDGRPTSVRLIDPTKFKDLNAAVESFAMHLTFKPGTCTKIKLPMVLQK